MRLRAVHDIRWEHCTIALYSSTSSTHKFVTLLRRREDDNLVKYRALQGSVTQLTCQWARALTLARCRVPPKLAVSCAPVALRRVLRSLGRGECSKRNPRSGRAGSRPSPNPTHAQNRAGTNASDRTGSFTPCDDAHPRPWTSRPSQNRQYETLGISM